MADGENLPHERTTPAGRFLAEAGRNADGDDIFWVDYDVAVSMHRVRAHVPAERRLQRLASPTSRHCPHRSPGRDLIGNARMTSARAWRPCPSPSSATRP